MKEAVVRWGGILAVGVCVALFVAFRVPRGISALSGKHEVMRQLQQENADLERDNAAMRDRIRKLRDSSSEKELEIRKRWKLQREGETSLLPDPARK
jgi:cell division protein FtsB